MSRLIIKVVKISANWFELFDALEMLGLLELLELLVLVMSLQLLACPLSSQVNLNALYEWDGFTFCYNI